MEKALNVLNDGETRLAVRAYGSDFIADMIAHYGIRYAAFNPGATFRGIHDSLVNYLGESKVEILECNHEEISVAIAHGYARATGKPMIAIAHNVVGLQHASMAIYNAWCDRVPVMVLGGTGPMNYENRRPGSDWVHTALIQGNQVRDYVKWDDQPADLESVPESFNRAYRTMMTEPQGPVYVCFDATIQESEYETFPGLPDIDRLRPASNPGVDSETLARIAKAILEAENPIIVADRAARTEEAFQGVFRLADEWMIPVIDKGQRHNFPNTHPMALSDKANELIQGADYILALDVLDLYGALHTVNRLTRQTEPLYGKDAVITHVTLDGYLVRSWAGDFRKLQPVNESIAADTAVFVPQLAEVCHVLGTGELQAAAQKNKAARVQKWGGRLAELRKEWRETAEIKTDEEPIALSTLALELWKEIQHEDWVLANGNLNGWVSRIWEIEERHQYSGKMPGGGLGYGIGASIGVALAHPDKLCVNIQSDGDMLFTPSALWTLAHHNIPMLIVMNNNRSYYNSEEHGMLIARHRGRPEENAGIGTQIVDPPVDFGKLAQSMGIYGEGPVTRSEDVGPAIRRALHIIKTEKRAALVDIVTQNR